MPRMKTPGQAPQIRFKIEEMGLTVGDLARLLAESLQNASLRQGDAEAYDRQAASERAKVQQLNNILFQLKERRRNPPAKLRRMDPLNEYEEEAVKAEIAMLKKRGAKFADMAAKFRADAEKHRRSADDYQRRLRDLSLSGKPRESREIVPEVENGSA